MILPGEKQKEGRHSEVILCSPSVQLRPPLPCSLWSLEQCGSQQKAQLVMLPIEGGDDPASFRHLEHPQVCLPKERRSTR